MQFENIDLVRLVNWAWVCDSENQMNSADYDLLMRIAVQLNNPILAEESARSRLHAIEHEKRMREDYEKFFAQA